MQTSFLFRANPISASPMTNHCRYTLATDLDVYFCDPHSPWQRNSNENTNRLLRQYFPKYTDLSVHSQTKLNVVAQQLNKRPRKTLEFETPAERFNACVASTVEPTVGRSHSGLNQKRCDISTFLVVCVKRE